MIDSFSEAVRCAEEALRDPGGLRYAHLPSLVAFVSDLRAGSAADAEWDPAELARGVQLNRLLWELGLRGEANELFTELAERLRRASPRNTGGMELANALASVGVRLGRLDETRAVLTRLADSVASGSAGAKYRADMTPAVRAAPGGVLGLVTWINLAAVELALGDITSAALRAGLARIWLDNTGLRETAEVGELLAGVELRLAAADTLPRGLRGDPAPDRPPYRHEELRRDPEDEARRMRRTHAMDHLSRNAEELVQWLDGGPRAFLAVAELAVAQFVEALDRNPRSVTTAVSVLEIACQRLSAMLGSDHPEVLGVLADLAAVQAEAARVARSPARLEQAVSQLASVSRRLEFRLGAGHPRSVAALANLATAQVESVRVTAEPGKAARTAQALAQQARRTGQLLGDDHPVARLVRASSTTCHRMAVGEGWGSEGSTMLKTLVDTPQGWDTEDRVYRSFAQATRRLGRSGEPARPRRRRVRAVRHRFSVEGKVASQAFGDVLPVAGDIVLGFVVEVGLSRVLLSLAGGAVGMVPADELLLRPDTDPREVCAVGEVMEAVVLHREDPGRPGGPVLSARRARSWRAWSDLERIKEKDGVVSGTVLGITEGGLVVDVGLRAFLPDGLFDTGQEIGPSGPFGRRRALGLREHVGTTVRAKIVALDREHDTVVLSHRAWREDRPSEPWEVRRGQIRSGVVTDVVKFGAFVSLGGVVGLVHHSELSWTRIGHPSEVVEVGQEITVEIIGIDLDAEGKHERVSLSLKRVHDGPWQRFVCAHRPGEIVEGKVTQLTPFGALVRVDGGIEGLLRPGELPRRGKVDAGQDMEVGDDLFVKIIDIDFGRRRTSFSLRRADEFPGDDPARAMFEPARYGMAAFCDGRGTLIPPDGFDEEAGAWLPGYEEQRRHFERRLEAAEARFRRHREWAVQRRGGTPPP
ncbi:S1 RNA-binding domain-containing protein [Streptomyces hirsutus]|uniref:S1 RNA-binding domain-containing protein n=1 Tax=Streptomyces hirsutus TaxID=35620 RepID=UPI0036B657D6